MSGRHAGLPDTSSCTAAHSRQRGPNGAHAEPRARASEVLDLARRHPVMRYDASAACAGARRPNERSDAEPATLPAPPAGPGPRWLRSMAELAIVARGWRREAADVLMAALLPHRGELVISGGAPSYADLSSATSVSGPHLGALDGRWPFLAEAANVGDRIGAPARSRQHALACSRWRRAAPRRRRRFGRASGSGHRCSDTLGMGRLQSPRQPRRRDGLSCRLNDGWVLVTAGCSKSVERQPQVHALPVARQSAPRHPCARARVRRRRPRRARRRARDR